MNGLRGRMAYLPAPTGKQGEILVLYGQRGSLEQCEGLLAYLHRFGAVTAPDLPGFGGMDSFYTIGAKPTIDNLADYVAAFIKLRYKRKKVVIVGASLGFVIATRMLQRNPELAKRTVTLIGLAPLTHYEDYRCSRVRLYVLRAIYWLRARWFVGWIAQRLARRNTVAGRRRCDPRTLARTSYELTKFNNCTRPVNVPAWEVQSANDTKVDQHLVHEHLCVIFSKVQTVTSAGSTYHPAFTATTPEVAQFFPLRLRRFLARLS